MKLEKLIVKNFRCYKEETEIIVDDLNCIIGRNDVGKSSILEALDAFFNDVIDVGDLSTDHDEPVISITCIFSGIPDKFILDSSVETDPMEEGILNKDGNLEVIREFTIGRSVGKAVYLNAENYLHEELSQLLELKNGSLKAKAESLKISLEGVNKSKNPEIRKAFRDHFGRERKNSRIKVEGNLGTESNLKTIWGKLKVILPIYSLFKVDKSLSDKDGDVQDPMKSAVEETLAISEIKDKLAQIEAFVQKKSTEVADRIIAKLKDIDASLAETLKSDLRKPPNWKGLFDLTLFNDEGIPLNKRGSGVRRLVLLSFFQSQAEKRKAERGAPTVIYAIEEPETSQHPNHQMLLINSLIDLSETDNTQVFFTSHSANLVREIPIQSLRYIVQDDDKLLVQNAWNFQTGKEINDIVDAVITTLGILPNPNDSVKVLVYVEGNNDVLALKRYSRIFVQEGEHEIALNDESIAWVITGGSSLKHYVDFGYLSGLGKPEVHIYDSDIPDYVEKVDEINALNNPRKKAFCTSKREMENFLHPEAINEAYQACNEHCNILRIDAQDDVPAVVAQNMYNLKGKNWEDLNVDKRKKKSDGKKKFLNTQAIDCMSIERLKETGGYEEIKSWLDQIQVFVSL